MNELKAAAERLKLDSVITGADVSASPYWSEYSGYVYQCRDADESLLARVFLPELDDTPIDDAWLESIGGRKLSCGIRVMFFGSVNDVIVNPLAGSIEVNNHRLPGIATRGQLLTLLRALGIRKE